MGGYDQSDARVINEQRNPMMTCLMLVTALAVGLVEAAFVVFYFPACWCYIFGAAGVFWLHWSASLYGRLHNGFVDLPRVKVNEDNIVIAGIISLIYLTVWGFYLLFHDISYNTTLPIN